jgi:hypothetical protein
MATPDISGTFPELPGVDIAIERNSQYKTTVFRTVSDVEQRVGWVSVPRYDFRVQFNFLRDNVYVSGAFSGSTEAGVVQKFFDDCTGSLKTFGFTDPYDSTVRTVRFKEDGLSIKRIVGNVWECSVDLQEVK